MRAFFAHLWKEQREHRLMLGAIGAAILLLTAGGAWAFHDKVFVVDGTPYYVAACTALTVLALATEMFAAEGRRDGFAFLRRLPRGLGTAWAAKVVFYVGACALTAAFGAATLLLVTQVDGGAPAVQQVLQSLDSDAVLLFPALVATGGFWILMVSLWVPRGAAAAGAAMLLLGALGAPVVLALRENSGFEVPRPWALAALGGAAALPLLASLLGLLRGLRFARNSWSAAWRGLALVLLVAAPCYAAGAARLERWSDLKADDPRVELIDGVVARGGRYAYMNLARRGEDIRTEHGRVTLTRAFRIDLSTGEATPMAPLGSSVRASVDALWLNAGLGSRTFGTVAVQRFSDPETLTWWDAERGVPLKTLPLRVISEDLVDRLRADLRDASPVRTPDGRRVWIFRGRMEHDAADGSVVSIPLPDGLTAGWSDGFGWSAYDTIGRSDDRMLVPDEAGRPTLVPRARKRSEWPRLRLTARRYLTRASNGGPWLLVEGDAATPASALGIKDEPIDRVDATHALFWHGLDTKHRGLFVADLEAGTSSPVALPAGAPQLLTDGFRPAVTRAGRKMFHLSDGYGQGAGYALFDAATNAFTSWTPGRDWGRRLLGIVDETTFVEAEGDRIVRRTFGSSDREVLWPRR
jgi:hypothetical protein